MVPLHDRDRQRQRPRGRPARQHRRAAGGRHRRPPRSAAVRLPASQRLADSHRARPPLDAPHRDAAGGRRDTARHHGGRRSAQRADRHPRHGRRGSRHPPGLHPEHPQLRACLAGSHLRRPDAQPGGDGDHERRGWTHPSLRSAARAREHLRPRAIRHPQHPPRRSDREARWGTGAVRRPDRHGSVSADAHRRDDDRREHAAAVSRGHAVAG